MELDEYTTAGHDADLYRIDDQLAALRAERVRLLDLIVDNEIQHRLLEVQAQAIRNRNGWKDEPPW